MESRGLNFIGDTTIDIGLGEATRSTLDAIISNDIPVSYIDYQYQFDKHLTHPQWTERYNAIKHGYRYDVNLISHNVLEYSQLNLNELQSLTHDSYSIAYWVWEQPAIPSRFHHAFYHVDEIWTASRFAQQAFAQIRPIPVHVIPYPVHIQQTKQLTASELGIPENRKTFFFSFSISSTLERKNPFGVIEAFRRAFPKDTPSSPILILKAHHTDVFPEETDLIKRKLADITHILIEHSLERQDMINLIGSIDYYISLHRSEGFGLGMAEAMLLGKPVIATNFSSNTDFMNINNSFPVRYTLTPTPDNIHVYEAGQLWAEPDIDHAAEMMQLVVSKPELAQERARLGQKTIQENYSPQVIGHMIKQRLAQIEPSVQNKVWTMPQPSPTYDDINLDDALETPDNFDMTAMTIELRKRFETWDYNRIPENRSRLLQFPVIGFVFRMVKRVQILGKVWADLKFVLIAMVALHTELVKQVDLLEDNQHTQAQEIEKLKTDMRLHTQHKARVEQADNKTGKST